jgi:replicative DNA helicase
VENCQGDYRVDLYESIPYLKTLFQRRIIDKELATEVRTMIEKGESIDVMKAHVHQTLMAIESDIPRESNAESARRYAREILEAQDLQEPPIIKTGLTEIDEKVPLRLSRYTTLAALPMTGKTTLAKSLSLKALSCNDDSAVKFFPRN